MQISTYIDGDEPPMLFLHGRKDKAVILRNLRLAREAIERNNGIVESHVYPDADHVDTVAALSWVNPANLDVASHMDQFFRQFLN
jgi:dipeptidyl aminopeptidase/acylaminoacyl peptidase